MTALTVWKFDSATGAADAIVKLDNLAKQYLIDIQDAAIIEWPQGKNKPKTHQAMNLVGAGAFSGGFWGLLFGLIFFVPIFGLAMGAAMGALNGVFKDYGIDDNFINSVRNEVTEGTSALFLLTGDVTVERVKAELEGEMGTLIRSNLTLEQEEKLREAFRS